jgi:hypothetical protein
VVNPICQAGQLVGGAAKNIGEDAFSAIANYFAKAASAMTGWLWHQLDSAASIDLTSTSIKSDLIATGAIAALVAFALFLIQVISSTLRQDPGGLGRAARGLGVAFLGAAFAVATTQLLLAAVDGLSNAVVHYALGTDMSGMGSKLIAASTLSSIANPAGLLLISLVIIAAVVIVWVALMIRKMLIIVAAVFTPIAFAGAASDISRSWVRRWIEFTVSLIFSKLILVIIFMIGLSVLNDAGSPTGSGGHPSTGQSLTNLAVGTLTLLLAGFAPWLAIKMVHFAGDSFHLAHSQASAAGTGARTVVSAPQKVTSTYQRHRTLMPAGATPAQSRSATLGQAKPASAAAATSGGGGAAAANPAGAALIAAAAAPRAAGSAARHAVERGMQTADPPPAPGPRHPPTRS